MTPTQFSRALTDAGMSPESRTARAVRLVLIDGLSDNAAAREIGVNPSAVTRARNRLLRRVPCPHCAGSGLVTP